MSDKLFMVLLGATVTGRLIEQHDVLFAVAENLSQLIPTFENAWPNASVHVDAWREVSSVQGHRIHLSDAPSSNDLKLYFFNLGGYVQGDMEEHHHKALVVATDKQSAIAQVKQSEFYQHRGFQGAQSHIDDQFTVDIDDIHVVNDLLSPSQTHLHITPETTLQDDDVWQVGYLALTKLAKRKPSIEA